MIDRDDEETVETPAPVDVVLLDAAALAGTTDVTDQHLVDVLSKFGWDRARMDAQRATVRAALEPKDKGGYDDEDADGVRDLRRERINAENVRSG